MLEQIEKYFNNELSLDERQAFENQIVTNDTFAKEVAFYVETRSVAKEIAMVKRKQELEELRKTLSKSTNFKIKKIYWLSGLAASLILGIGAWNFIVPNSKSSETLADRYIHQHFENLPVKMDGNSDSLQLGLRLFNEQKLNQAGVIFEDLANRNNNNSEAIKYAGIAALRQNNFDKANKYFQTLATQKDLYSNPGLFYKAISLLKQSPENQKKAKEILNEVITKNLDGKVEAEEILEDLRY